MMRKEDCTLLKVRELSPGYPLDWRSSELQNPKSTEKRKFDIKLIPWKRQAISLKCVKLGKIRKKAKWVMNISAIEHKHCDILQKREPLRLEKVGSGKWRMEPQFSERSSSWNEVKQMSEWRGAHTCSFNIQASQHIHWHSNLKTKLIGGALWRKWGYGEPMPLASACKSVSECSKWSIR
jgi:hypothetical protein